METSQRVSSVTVMTAEIHEPTYRTSIHALCIVRRFDRPVYMQSIALRGSHVDILSTWVPGKDKEHAYRQHGQSHTNEYSHYEVLLRRHIQDIVYLESAVCIAETHTVM